MSSDRTTWSEPGPGWRGELAFFVRWALVRYAVYAALFLVDEIFRPGRSLAFQLVGYAFLEGVFVFAWLCGVAYRARVADATRGDKR